MKRIKELWAKNTQKKGNSRCYFFGTFNTTSEKQKEHFWKCRVFLEKEKYRKGRIKKLNLQQAAAKALQCPLADQHFDSLPKAMTSLSYNDSFWKRGRKEEKKKVRSFRFSISLLCMSKNIQPVTTLLSACSKYNVLEKYFNLSKVQEVNQLC